MIPGGTQSTDREVEESTPEPERERGVVSEEEEEHNADSKIAVTEPPVSQLSQKHMFWFPSEAFQDEKKHPGITTDSSSVKSSGEDENHMKVKTTDSQSDPDMITEEHDHPTDPPTDEPASPSAGGTDESWLDGYPVTQDEDKAGGESTGEAGPEQAVETESVTGHSEVEVFEDVNKNPVEEETGDLIYSPEEEEDGETKNPEDKIHKKGEEEELGKGTTRLEKEESVVSHYEETTEGLAEDEMEKETYSPKETDSDGSKTLGLDGVTDSPNGVEIKPTTLMTQTTPSPDDIALHKRPMAYTPASAPENVSTSQGGLGPENTSTPSGMVSLDDEVTSMPTPVIKDPWETIDNGHLLEHIPGHVPTEIPENRSVMERGGDPSLDLQDLAGEGSCAEDPCHGSGRGPMIAAIIIGVVAAVVGMVLGVWCYKKRQLKSSHYQLNGTNRQTQCIELQQTV